MTVLQLIEMYRKIGEYLKPLGLKAPKFGGLTFFGFREAAQRSPAVSGRALPEAALTFAETRGQSAFSVIPEAGIFPLTGKTVWGANAANKAAPLSFGANPLPTMESVLYTVPFFGGSSNSSLSVKGLDNIQLGKNAYAAEERSFAEGRSVSGDTQSAFPRYAVNMLPSDVWEKTSHLRYPEADGLAGSAKSGSSDSSDFPERLRMLRGAAESAAGSAFGSSSVQVDLSGMCNTVNSANDMDELIDRLCGAFTEAAYSMAEGVHY